MNSRRFKGRRRRNRPGAFAGFTLIELLVVVAVIGILAAIGIPNLLEAETRSKVSRSEADLRTIRVALEAYAVDERTYPLNAGGLGFSGALVQLLHPRPYLSSLPHDPFLPSSGYLYLAPGHVLPQASPFGGYVLAGRGPDRHLETTLDQTTLYDPTNGTVSRGDIVTAQKTR